MFESILFSYYWWKFSLEQFSKLTFQILFKSRDHNFKWSYLKTLVLKKVASRVNPRKYEVRPGRRMTDPVTRVKLVQWRQCMQLDSHSSTVTVAEQYNCRYRREGPGDPRLHLTRPSYVKFNFSDSFQVTPSAPSRLWHIWYNLGNETNYFSKWNICLLYTSDAADE